MYLPSGVTAATGAVPARYQTKRFLALLSTAGYCGECSAADPPDGRGPYRDDVVRDFYNCRREAVLNGASH
jgi:hypothetical protein